MKIFTLLSLLFLSTSVINAQVDTELRIYHMLGTQMFQMNTAASNNLAQDFKVTRLSYYMSEVTVVHDGGQETAVSIDTVSLLHANAVGGYTAVQLGNLAITSVEGVKFHIGVKAPTNNGDPGLFPSYSPLSPQSPSMHWGWASGYRFIAYEGEGGPGFLQVFQLHGLYNENYFETSVTTSAQLVGSTLIIPLDADYERGLEDIDVSAGTIAHGVNSEDLKAIENFRDFVFTASSQTIMADVPDSDLLDSWSVFPNPTSSDNINILLDPDLNVDQVVLINTLGQTVDITDVNPGEALTLTADEAGVYFVQLLSVSNVLSVKRVVKP